MNIKLGFIGAGNMGSALIKGIAKSGLIFPENIYVFDKQAQKTEELKKLYSLNIMRSSGEVVQNLNIIILAVKPNIVKEVLEQCKDFFDDKKLLVSVAVGIPIKFYKDILGSDRKIIRTMPNTPALVGEGMTLVSFDNNIEETDIYTVVSLFETVGKVEILDESLMSEVTALTSSSPAYVFMFIEAMADAAVLSGIPRDIAYRLAAQAVLGSARMVLNTGKHPGELKDQVCSPAGTTIEAVASLEKNGFRYAIIEAMNECTRKAREIGKKYG
ncbi:MAG TPA: pyrroline-5-carboxylate reductase [Clostridiaceae bacterium]|nr:pyrroline-5-carboxylate reductase [Clostridiaceae bacterium]